MQLPLFPLLCFFSEHHAAPATLPSLQDEEDDDEEEELCNCEFSLGYGGRILLNNATLRLKRGRRYGLCGANGAGKVRCLQSV